MKHFDVIVIGGGHAGVEAAAISARLGAETMLITLRLAGIGVMSCNPAIGGLGKGHLVREIDAMDGLMGMAADQAGIQFRLLNRRKGPAVQGPRAQTDRKLYQNAIQAMIGQEDLITTLEAEVARLIVTNGRAIGVVLSDASEVFARSIVLTAGTFLNGIMHIGDQKQPGGRVGDKPSVRLADQLIDLGLMRGRLKTGTPPRLDGRTIDWHKLERQAGDDEPVLFSFLNAKPFAAQVSCGITHTNERTHDIVRNNIDKSAMYGGYIKGVGPRYCPSIEDKVIRFSDKNSHQVFLEPEGLDDDTVYPNGISTSLPANIQEDYVRSIVGLESAKIMQSGYAIEYDYFDPRGLTTSLELRALPGLFLAGQINGTTGYEEAAAQGLVAGLSAAHNALGRAAIKFSRSSSYIGVMLDDLTARGVTEPYRMFTSRAEYRLALRADNADQRLTTLGLEIGCIRVKREKAFKAKMAGLIGATSQLKAVSFTPKALEAAGIKVSKDGTLHNAWSLLAFPDVSIEQVINLVPEFRKFDLSIHQQVARDALYAPYLARQEKDITMLAREENTIIPDDFHYIGMAGLSTELTAKLCHYKPISMAAAAQIEGMTPAALTLILAQIRKQQRGMSA